MKHSLCVPLWSSLFLQEYSGLWLSFISVIGYQVFYHSMNWKKTIGIAVTFGLIESLKCVSRKGLTALVLSESIDPWFLCLNSAFLSWYTIKSDPDTPQTDNGYISCLRFNNNVLLTASTRCCKGSLRNLICPRYHHS